MGKIVFDIWFCCYRYGSNFRDGKIPLGYCEKLTCIFFKGNFYDEKTKERGIICELIDIEKECKNCLYEHNQKDDNTCGRCSNWSGWHPNSKLIDEYVRNLESKEIDLLFLKRFEYPR